MVCLFKEKINHFKAFKNCQIIRPESLPLSKVQFPLRVTQNESLVITITILILAFICLWEFSQGGPEKDINFTWLHWLMFVSLTHSFPMHPFSNPWKYQKTVRKRKGWEKSVHSKHGLREVILETSVQFKKNVYPSSNQF